MFRARRAFIAPELWKAEIVASDRRASLQYSDNVPGDPWRYEWLLLPSSSLKEDDTLSWANQQLDSEKQDEAQRQNAFYAASRALGGALLRGELQASGKLGSMVGSWTEIPADAWLVMRVPYENGLQNWRLGRAIGPGLDFWNIRIRHRIGLMLLDAATAYGPLGAADIVYRATALGMRERAPPNSKMTDLDRRMASTTPIRLLREKPTAKEFAEARRSLSTSLLALLRSGVLVGESWESKAARLIHPDQWSSGVANLSASSLVSAGETFEAIRVRVRQQGEVFSLPVQGLVERGVATVAPAPTKAETEAWYTVHLDSWTGAHPPTEEEDIAAFKKQFGPSVSRDRVRKIRRARAPEGGHRRGPKPKHS